MIGTMRFPGQVVGGLAVLGWLVWGLSACGNPTCGAGEMLKEGRCVPVAEVSQEKQTEPLADAKEAPTPEESSPVELTTPEEPASVEPVADAKELVQESAVTPEESVSSEPAQESGGREEPAADGGNTEPVQESPPEPTPEPTGPVPTVKITTPKDGDTFKDTTVEVEVTASVAAGGLIDRVSLYLDGKFWGDAQRMPYRFSIPKGRLDDGKHVLKAVATTQGYQQATDEIKVTTAFHGPSIAFLQPKASAQVSAVFVIEVEVKTALGLQANGVVLKVDGQVVSWDSTTPTYKATFDPKGKAYDSLPLEVIATDTSSKTNTKRLVVVHTPTPGPKKAGEACDNADPQKRCVAGHSCLNITGTPECYANCDTSASSNSCQTQNCKLYSCQPAFMGTQQGVCFPTGPAPGCLDYECTQTQRCNTGLICVGAGSGSNVRRWCMATCTVGSVLQGCRRRGYKCVPISGGSGTFNGVCVELCQQPCKSNTDCGDGQSCNNGKCSGPFCQDYSATCRSVQAGTDSFNACI